MPTILIKEVRQKPSLCLVGSLEFTPPLSQQASSLFFLILPSPGVRIGGECENPWPQARICDASGRDDAHPNFSLLSLPQHGAALAESKVLFLNKTTQWATHPPLTPLQPFPRLSDHWGRPWPHLETPWCSHTWCWNIHAALSQIHLKNNLYISFHSSKSPQPMLALNMLYSNFGLQA